MWEKATDDVTPVRSPPATDAIPPGRIYKITSEREQSQTSVGDGGMRKAKEK